MDKQDSLFTKAIAKNTVNDAQKKGHKAGFKYSSATVKY